MIVSKTFNHGVPYTFSFDEEKIRKSGNPHWKKFSEYAQSLTENRLPDGFSSPPRASGMRYPLLGCSEIHHPLKDFCGWAHRVSIAGRSHERLEIFLMVSDKATVAVEVPVWMTPAESHLFDSNLTGHIDLIRLTDKIEIWDYKPFASREVFASSQVYWYCRMLQVRLNVDADEFRCGFFDERHVYVIEPGYIPQQKTLKDYV